MRDRSDSHARERALLIAQQDQPPGVSPEQAVAAVRDVLDAIGDPCPECRPEGMSTLSEKGPRRLQAAPQRRLDRARVLPTVECLAGKENRPTITS